MPRPVVQHHRLRPRACLPAPRVPLAPQEIEAGRLWKDKPAPPIALDYWKLAPSATMHDLILAVRADEACHSHVNHTFAAMKTDDTNPFAVGSGHTAP